MIANPFTLYFILLVKSDLSCYKKLYDYFENGYMLIYDRLMVDHLTDFWRGMEGLRFSKIKWKGYQNGAESLKCIKIMYFYFGSLKV